MMRKLDEFVEKHETKEFKEPTKHIWLAVLGCFLAACAWLSLVAGFPLWFPLAVLGLLAATALMLFIGALCQNANFGMLLLFPLFIFIAMWFGH